MLSHTDLKKGVKLILDGEPYEVLESSFVFKGRGSSLLQTKIKNLITGNVLSRTFHPGEEFEEVEIEKIKVKFLYFHTRAAAKSKKILSFPPSLSFARSVGKEGGLSSSPRDKFFFSKENDSFSSESRSNGTKGKKKTKISSPRFDLPKEVIGAAVIFLKPGETVEGMQFEGRIINISLPIKVQLRVTEAPPGVKGDRAQGGTKTVTLETEAKINTPLFIESGDIIEVNTETGEYVRRVEEH